MRKREVKEGVCVCTLSMLAAAAVTPGVVVMRGWIPECRSEEHGSGVWVVGR
jgi:hypothetical protein